MWCVWCVCGVCVVCVVCVVCGVFSFFLGVVATGSDTRDPSFHARCMLSPKLSLWPDFTILYVQNFEIGAGENNRVVPSPVHVSAGNSSGGSRCLPLRGQDHPACMQPLTATALPKLWRPETCLPPRCLPPHMGIPLHQPVTHTLVPPAHTATNCTGLFHPTPVEGFLVLCQPSGCGMRQQDHASLKGAHLSKARACDSPETCVEI